MKPDICIYHAPCQDGFTAAWAIWRRWPDVEFVPGVYGQDPPDVTGKDVLIVDFSYRRPVLEKLARSARWITILDHHKSALEDLAPWACAPFDETDGKALGLAAPGNIQARFDMTKSGAMLAWEYAHPGQPIPKLVQHVQDRDLWRFELHGTREVCAEIFSRPYGFDVWSDLAFALDEPDLWARCFVAGEAIERKHHKDVAELLEMTTRRMIIGGELVEVANLPYTMSSDAANMLAASGIGSFGACYYDNAEGKRVFSLRSVADGADVQAIAVRYGGGGHARAAGFTAPKGWEGDQ
jgi:oligoribonuclease NrnB/cAMP/cGMP phosphodiesterase (DHH superfamily)